MSARINIPSKTIFDTNTILEPIYLCIGGRKYRVEDKSSLQYFVTEDNGLGCLYMSNGVFVPLKKMK